MSRSFQFDAYAAYLKLKERYAAFLLDHFGLNQGPLYQLLKSLWTSPETNAYQLFAPPLLEAAFPFEPGETLEALTFQEQASHARPLSPRALELFQKAGLPQRLYRHQVETVHAAASGQTVVLSAGTGSGKTESFLIPLVNRLLRDHAEGRDNLKEPGVRAIILYPLNALVNNQVERLRALLKSQELLKFAFYTSRLPEQENQARRMLERRGQTPPACEVLDRKTLRGLDTDRTGYSGPPHILVTNYSMLEYLLVRPDDQTLFRPDHIRGPHGPRLKAIVLDEAHVYAGSMAAEIHMLLRRTAQRFGSSLEAVQGYATSATLSQEGGQEPGDAMRTFLMQMFSKTPEQVQVIVGQRTLPAIQAARKAPRLTCPEALDATQPLIPPGLHTLSHLEDGSVAGLTRDAQLGAAAGATCEALGLATRDELKRLSRSILECPARLLYQVMSTHPQLQALRQWMMNRKTLPDLSEVAETLYGKPASAGKDAVGAPDVSTRVHQMEEEARCRAAHAILHLASLAREDAERLPLIPSRMHVFGRSPAGVWVSSVKETLPGNMEGWPWGRLQALPPEPSSPDTLAELLLCRTCGTPFLLAYDDGESLHFREDPLRVPVALRPASLEDEAAGHLVRALSADRGGARVRVLNVDTSREGKTLREACPTCADAEATLSSLSLSTRFALGAIVDSIYPHLGEMPSPSSAEYPAGGRRILTFSDSRQGAAEVAARVEKTHAIGLARQLLWKVLNDQPTKPMPFKTLAKRLSRHPLLHHLPDLPDGHDISKPLEPKDALTLAQNLIFRELATPPSRAFRSLERSGLVEVVYPELPSRPPSIAWLTEAEWQDLLAIVLDELRRAGAISCKDVTLGETRHFSHRFVIWSDVFAATEDDVNERGAQFKFGRKGRARFIADVLERLRATEATPSVPLEALLLELWNTLVTLARGGDCDWLEYDPKNHNGALQLQLDGLEMRACTRPGFIEPRSQEVYFRSVRGICPNRSAPFHLEPLDEDAYTHWKHRHAVSRVITDPPLGLLSLEHTAQLDVDRLETQEGAFKQGQRNLLASSTTMEMGIDLGGLTCVMLTNVPPGPANYWQRAGRAGRRAEGSALVLTLARPLPHDQKVFAKPREFLHARLTPPRVRLDTRALLLRHVQASLLGAFFEQVLKVSKKGNPMHAFGTVDAFLYTPALGTHGLNDAFASSLRLNEQDTLAVAFHRWLERLSASGDENEGKAGTLTDRLNRLTRGTVLELTTPAELAQTCALELTRALQVAEEELQEITRMRAAEQEKGAGAANDPFLHLLELQERDIKKETLMGYLARTGFLPGFGFPTQVVRLDTRWQVSDRSRRGGAESTPSSAGTRTSTESWSTGVLRMERSLGVALSEYAPGAEVLADKKIYQSAGMIPNWQADEDPSAFRRHYYSRCLKCGHMEDRLTQLNQSACRVCKSVVVPQPEFVEQAGKSAQERATLARHIREGRAEPQTPPLATPQVIWRSYLEPRGFAVAFGTRPRALEGERRRLPATRSQVLAGGADQTRELLEDRLAVGYSSDSRIFIRSEGQQDSGSGSLSGFGYLVCRLCGFAMPEHEWAGGKKGKPNLPRDFAQHLHLRKGKRCAMTQQYWRNAVLGCSQKVDTLRIRLLGEAIPQMLSPSEHLAFMQSFALLLKLRAAEMLQVDARLIGATTAPWMVDAEDLARLGDFQLDAVLYDESSSGLLSLLEEDAQKLVQETLETLCNQEDADFVLYETQGLLLEGMLRLDLLRQHFFAPGHVAERLKAQSFLDQEDVQRLKGLSPLTKALELLGPGYTQTTLLAARLSGQAYEAEGLLRALMHRGTSEQPKRVSRLFLSSTALHGLSLLEKQRLGELLSHGIDIRLSQPQDDPWLRQTPWRIVAQGPRGRAALGGMQPSQAGQAHAAVGSTKPTFGPDWMEGVVPVMAGPYALALLEDSCAAAWTRARPLEPEQLRPLEQERIVKIPGGSTRQEFIRPQRLLDALVPVAVEDWGRVQTLEYSDRYVCTSGIALWMLQDLLSAFTYAPGAQLRIRSEHGHFSPHVVARSRKELLESKRPPDLLSAEEAETLVGWIRDRQKAHKLELTYTLEKRGILPHGRFLRVVLEPGGKLKSVTLFFDRGLDWVRMDATPPGPWSQAWGHCSTRETFVAARSEGWD